MKTKRWFALALAALLAVGLLAGCGGSGAVSLNNDKVEAFLQESGIDATVEADDSLTRAARDMAQTLSGQDYAQIDASMSTIRQEIAGQAGVGRLAACAVYGDSYRPSTPLGALTRYEETLASCIRMEGNGDGAYKAAVVRFTSRDGMKLVLYVAAEA